MVAERTMDSYCRRAGANYIMNDAIVDPNKQIAFLEDLVATERADAVLILAVNEAMLAPAVDKATVAGLPVFACNFDVTMYTPNVVAFVYNDFDGPTGTNLVGEFFVQKAEETGKPINIFEVWGDMTSQSSMDRHVGFHAAVDPCPLITVIESSNTQWSDELGGEFTRDAFTAHPELNGLFVHGGGCTGAVEALNSLGRLYPPDDPRHVIIAVNDVDTRVLDTMDAGNLDACGSHTGNELWELATLNMFNYVVLGQPVPKRTTVPMVVITPENVDTVMLGGEYDLGRLAAWPRLPANQFDSWPVLDGSKLGITTPTVEMRKQLLGY